MAVDLATYTYTAFDLLSLIPDIWIMTNNCWKQYTVKIRIYPIIFNFIFCVGGFFVELDSGTKPVLYYSKRLHLKPARSRSVDPTLQNTEWSVWSVTACKVIKNILFKCSR